MRLFVVLLIGVAGLLVLQRFGVRSGIAVVDSRLARLNSVPPPRFDPNGDEAGNISDLLSAARGIVDDLIDEIQPESARPARPVQTATADSSPDGAGSLVVQVGVFHDPANAARLAMRIAELGLTTITERVNDLHAVRMGPFPDRSLADEAARAVRDATGLNPFVVEWGRRSGATQFQTR